MNWFSNILPGVKKSKKPERHNVPEGVWEKCPQCMATIYSQEKEKNAWVCPHCGYHERISAPRRALTLFDGGEAVEFAQDVRPYDFLKFTDSKSYKERLDAALADDARREALRVYYGEVRQVPLVAAIFDFGFMGGSMGSVVGERFSRGVEEAIERGVPFVSFSSSGGARMQEGVVSLFQMAKTTAVLSRLAARRLPYVSVLADPTTGGVAASFAMIADVVVAEPNALVGFAGPRVIEETVRETLPDGFQRSEFLLKHGAVDAIWQRKDLPQNLARLLSMLMTSMREYDAGA